MVGKKHQMLKNPKGFLATSTLTRLKCSPYDLSFKLGSCLMSKKNKRGWIRIVEVFVAVSLIMGVLLVVLEQTYPAKDISEEIYEQEVAILREIQLNNSLRNEIIGASSLPIEWDDFGSNGLANVKNKTISETPNYLICEAQVCDISNTCDLDKTIEKDVYAQSVFISTNLSEYNPRQLKLFCWPR